MKRLILAVSLILALTVRVRADEGFRCTQAPIVAQESIGTVTLEMMREGDLTQPAMARFSMQELMGPNDWDDTGYLLAAFPHGSDKATVQWPISDAHYTNGRTLRAICFGMLGTDVPWGTSDGHIDIQVLEDDPHPTIGGQSTFVVTEGETVSPVITATPPFVRNTNLSVIIRSGSASWNEFGVPSSMTMLANAQSSWLPITTYEDEIAESDETIELEIWGAPGLLKTIHVTIVDDDHAPAPMSLDRTAYLFDEGGANEVTITRDGPATLAATATLHIDTDDVARWPIDVPLNFAPGETTKTVSMPFNDAIFSGNRIATLQLIAPNGFIADDAEVAMSDEDVMPVLSLLDAEVIEGNEKKQLELTLTLTAPLGVDLIVDVKTAHGTAGASDYTPIDRKVVFVTGSLSQRFTIDILGDTAKEDDETFRVNITGCCSSLAFLDRHSATVTIRNDDDGSVDDSVSAYRFDRLSMNSPVRESQKWLSAAIVRSGNIKSTSTVQARLTVSAARVFAPIDVTFRPRETRKIVRFYIDDPFYSGNASGTFDLYAGTQREDRQGVTIYEDEATPVIAIADVDITEDDVDRRTGFVLTVTPPSFQPIESKFMLSSFGVSSQDYSGIRNGQTLTIPSLRSTMTIGFDVIGDNNREPEESFGFDLILLGETVAKVQRGAVCTIRDDDPLVIGGVLTVPPTIARDANTTITITLVSSWTAEDALRVSTSTPDLVSVPSTVTIPANARSATFQVMGLRTGNANISVELPARHGRNVVGENTLVYNLTTPILPELVRVPIGTIGSVKLALPSPADDEVLVGIESMNRAIAGAESSVLLAPHGGLIEIYGASIGNTTLAITLPAELGGTTVQLPVEVFEPGPAKKRAARH